MRKLTALLAGLLLAPMAVSQNVGDDPEVAEEEPVRRYTVEVIIFSYAEDVSVGTELFLPDEPPPEELLLDDDGNPILPVEQPDAIPVYGDDVVVEEEAEAEEQPPAWVVVPGFDADAAAETVPIIVDDEEPDPFQLVLLAEEEFSLVDVADRFELLDAYETLMHFGWTQPTFPEEETPAIELRLLGEPPPGLDGTLTLYLSRYLHLVVDLALDAPADFEEEVVDDESFFNFGDARPTYGDDLQTEAPVVRFRIQEDRILKNNELRYFDHPKFGILAKVTRVEEPEDDEELEPLAARP
ncbi:MAG: CsiV family protein [Woeseiaceae bacterium]|nr:CsiV family protein [Woeseiaceae bacterium]